jgi:dATP pyrophosphohydrolase
MIMQKREFQILVFPFRKCGKAGCQYAIFKTKEGDYWQAIAGGGNSGECFLEAAKREALEEGGIPESADYFVLETVNSVAIHNFIEPTPKGKYVISEHCFAVDCAEIEIVLSPEHSEYRWVDYKTAEKMLHWDSNRTAIWELEQRMIDNKMISASKL